MLLRSPESPCAGHFAPAPPHVCFPRPQLPSRARQCQRSRRNRRWSLEAVTKEIPIFPLNVVAFPACSTPLHIFEARYRVLFNTLLSGESGLEDDLIREDSPFLGTKEFGMCWITQRGMATVGTTLQIQRHQRFPDGRMEIDSKGVERFRVLKVCQERPVLICDVEVLPEEDDSTTTLATLGDSVRQNFRDFLALNHRLAVARRRAEAAKEGRPEGDPAIGPKQPPDEVERLSPRALSFWISSLFHESQLRQQTLLEENSTTRRLTHLEELLSSSVSYIRAKLALDGAFSAPSIAVDAPLAEAAAQGDPLGDSQGEASGLLDAAGQQGQAEPSTESAPEEAESPGQEEQKGAPDRPEEGPGSGT